MKRERDTVNHPKHYTSLPSKCECGLGIECIQIAEHMNFCVGNAIKYLWRCDDKGDPIENLRKAAWYIEREIGRRIAILNLPAPGCSDPTAAADTSHRPGAGATASD